MGEAATVHEACRPSCLARLGVEASGEPEGGAAAAAARAAPTVGGEEGGGLVEGSTAALEPLRAYEETKRRTPSWRHSEYSHSTYSHVHVHVVMSSCACPHVHVMQHVHVHGMCMACAWHVHVHAPQTAHASCTRHPLRAPQVRPRAMVLVAWLCGTAAAALLRLRAADRLLRPHARALRLHTHPRVPPPRGPLSAHPGLAPATIGSPCRASDASRCQRPG